MAIKNRGGDVPTLFSMSSPCWPKCMLELAVTAFDAVSETILTFSSGSDLGHHHICNTFNAEKVIAIVATGEVALDDGEVCDTDVACLVPTCMG